MPRVCLPEILDTLPANDPEAARNRRDLRLINRIVGTRAWFARTLGRLARPGERILEIGAGTGELALFLQARGFAVDGLDLWPEPPGWPRGRAWHTADLRRFGGYRDYPVIIANLIFHQFEDPALRDLGARFIPSCRLFLASEPERRALSRGLIRVLGPLLRASPVTMHDARVSVLGGFRGRELAGALGLPGAPMHISAKSTALGMNRTVAERAP